MTRIHHATIAKAEKQNFVPVLNEDENFIGWKDDIGTFATTSPKAGLNMAIINASLMAEYPRLSIEHNERGIEFYYSDAEDAFLIGTLEGDETLADVLELAAQAASENEDWDIEGGQDEGEDEPTGSVVRERYRKEYLARGDGMPESCGDWLAEHLEGWCKIQVDGKGRALFNIENFEKILRANGIEPEGFKAWTNRSPGWQGRLRMSLRLALEKALYSVDTFTIPASLTGDEDTVLQIPEEWKIARQSKD